MEKLKRPLFAGLKSAERLKDIYRQAYLELEAGNKIKLSRFNNFEVDWTQIEENETFETFHSLDADKVLRYTCQLEAPNEVQALLDKIEQAEFSTNYTQELNNPSCFYTPNLARSRPQTHLKSQTGFQKLIFKAYIQIVKNTSEIGWTSLPKRAMMSGILIITDKDFMDDYETNQYLKKLGAEIRE